MADAPFDADRWTSDLRASWTSAAPTMTAQHGPFPRGPTFPEIRGRGRGRCGPDVACGTGLSLGAAEAAGEKGKVTGVTWPPGWWSGRLRAKERGYANVWSWKTPKTSISRRGF